MKSNERRNCKECGKEFDVTEKKKIFCSEQCQRDDYNRRRREKRVKYIKVEKNAVCVICGKPFSYVDYNHHKMRLCCSSSCYDKNRRRLKPKPKKRTHTQCEMCGVDVPYNGRKPKQFCDKCKAERTNIIRRNKRSENVNKYMFFAARNRAKKKGIEFNIHLNDVVIPNNCPILNIPIFCGKGKMIDNSPTLDRIDCNKGYIKGNVLVVSNRANMIKNNGTPEEHRRIADWLDCQLGNKEDNQLNVAA